MKTSENPSIISRKPKSMNVIERFWCFLGGNTALLFGRESASAMVWMLLALSARFLVLVFKLGSVVPIGFLFASPYVLQVLTERFNFVHEAHPLLAVRLAESVLGRVDMLKLTIIIPAHFLGCLLGAAIFYTLCPFNHSEVFMPLYNETPWSVPMFVLETALTTLYTVAVLVLPCLLQLNRMKRCWIGVVTLPLVLVPGMCYHPAADYALWYVRSKGFNNLEILQHIVGTVVGATCGGIVLSYYFPDDPKSWRRK